MDLAFHAGWVESSKSLGLGVHCGALPEQALYHLGLQNRSKVFDVKNSASPFGRPLVVGLECYLEDGDNAGAA